MNYTSIPTTELPKLIAEESTLIDVRTPAEFKSVHVKGAKLHPLDQLDATAFSNEHGNDKPIYIICQSGKRAQMAADKFITAGHRAPIVVEGGTEAAINAGIEVISGKGVMSIERQVRVAAGGLVFTGTLLGLFVHPGFFGLPAFVGAGLVFAGVSDTCGMGMMLAKCPWNQ